MLLATPSKPYAKTSLARFLLCDIFCLALLALTDINRFYTDINPIYTDEDLFCQKVTIFVTSAVLFRVEQVYAHLTSTGISPWYH